MGSVLFFLMFSNHFLLSFYYWKETLVLQWKKHWFQNTFSFDKWLNLQLQLLNVFLNILLNNVRLGLQGHGQECQVFCSSGEWASTHSFTCIQVQLFSWTHIQIPQGIKTVRCLRHSYIYNSSVYFISGDSCNHISSFVCYSIVKLCFINDST